MKGKKATSLVWLEWFAENIKNYHSERKTNNATYLPKEDYAKLIWYLDAITSRQKYVLVIEDLPSIVQRALSCVNML